LSSSSGDDVHRRRQRQRDGPEGLTQLDWRSNSAS
jgi:hypothetical protein